MPHDQTPVIPKTSSIPPNQSIPTGQNMNAQSNTAAEATSSQRNVSASGWNHLPNALIPLHCLSKVKLILMGSTSFKSEVDPNGINWKGVSQDVKDGNFGEFKKNFYWDASVSEVVVKQQWMKKAALCYKNFISNIKKHRATVQSKFENDHVWKKWIELWQSDDCVKKSEINSKNHCGGQAAANFLLCFQQATTMTAICCYFSCKHLLLCHFVLQLYFLLVSLVFSLCFATMPRCLALKIGRDPTPSELHLHVHTHNHDGKSFVGERSRLLHERHEEIVQKKVQCESEIDQLETYYEAMGGAKKTRLFGLGSEAASYFGKKFCTSNSSTSSVPPLISIPTKNMEEFVKQLILALTTHFLPIVIERFGGIRV
ncbi:uncharacterized protein LOC107874041 [Capsicum annuum]|uniref:uncharacterized protein LOC107874041 n=1 Tax=Capsicum annuum TaxID=4072 RepID=UPI001FB04D6E|nr:uncharacterized protein LOC107874041 [Capsicum annuum]